MIGGMNLPGKRRGMEDLTDAGFPQMIGDRRILHPDPRRVETQVGDGPREQRRPWRRFNGVDGFDINESLRQRQNVRITDKCEPRTRVLHGERSQNRKIQNKITDSARANDQHPAVRSHEWKHRLFPETQYWLDVRTIQRVQYRSRLPHYESI